jgi:hypothetical protein
MTVHFIGAGPGAPDLITVRGRDLVARCPVCLYAGSLVPREILDFCPPGARIVNTAALSLEEIATLTGLEEAALERFYALWSSTERVVSIYSQGVNQSTSGTDKVNAIINCHLLTGRIGKPGTVLVCLVPALQGLWSEWDERLGHQRRYTTRTLRGHLTMAGWKPVSLQYMFPSMVLPALARRWAGVTGGADEFPAVPQWVDRALGGWTAMENRFRRWPFGTSVAALAIT